MSSPPQLTRLDEVVHSDRRSQVEVGRLWAGVLLLGLACEPCAQGQSDWVHLNPTSAEPRTVSGVSGFGTVAPLPDVIQVEMH